MSFLTNLRAERHVATIKASPDRTRPATQHAIARLKALGPGAIEPVIAALPDADPSATVAFVEVLSAQLTERTFRIYMRALLKGSARITSGITWALTGSRNYPPFLLLEALAIPGAPKAALLEVITAQKARFQVRELLAAAYTHDAPEKAALFRIIGEIADSGSLALLISRLAGKDPVARVHIINLLSRFSGPEVQAALTARLADPDKMIRGAVLDALQRMDGAIDVRAVSALLLDPELEVQSRAVDLLILKANQPATVQHLIEVLREANPSARRAAVEVLNEIGLRHLLMALQGKDWQLRFKVTDALGRTGGPRLIQTTLHLVQDADENVRRAAIDILNHANDESAVDWLLEAASDLDPWVAARAVDALAEIGSHRAVPRLVELLESPTAPALPSLVRALGRLGDTQLVDTLMPFKDHAEREVRIEAIQALANLAGPERADELMTALRPLVSSPDATISRLASFAIEVIESRTAVDIAVGAPPPAPPGERRSGGAFTGPSPTLGRSHRRRTGLTPRPVRPPPPMPPPQTAGLDIARLKSGDLLESRYRFIERIGRGAFGTVLLTEDTVVGEQLILKFINQNLGTDEEVMRRFVHELRYSRKITHPNVIRIYDFHNIQGSYAISMEYFPSHTLAAELLHDEPLPFPRVPKLGIDICNGMEAAHEQGIVHRDLKPANVLINDDGLLKIVDFGVAAAWRESYEDDLTRPGYVIGSPKYMAPEQITGKKVDHRADIYALGVILYEMATGVPPYAGGDHMAIMFQHVQGKARLPLELNPQLAPDFSDLIMKAMALEKRRRFQSMTELRAALELF